MMPRNFIAKTDTYKLGHFEMRPDGTTYEQSYFYARPGGLFSSVLWNGLQPLLREYFEGEVVTRAMAEEMQALQGWHVPGTRFNAEGWNHIIRDRGGRLPLRIKAAPEGLVIPAGVPLMSVKNTSPKAPFLGSYVESILSKVWYPTAVATLGSLVKPIFVDGLTRTGCNPNAADYMLHDFGYRSVSSEESAAIGGCAHLILFNGSDTIEGLRFARHHYGAVPGFALSVTATQHEVMTALGKAGEYTQAMRVIQANEGQIVSIVGDSYDYKAFVDHMIDNYDQIAARRVQFVCRADSTIPGDLETPQAVVRWTYERQKARLSKYCETTPTGHVRTPYGVLWGDGLELPVIGEIRTTVVDAGFAMDKLVLGMGGGLLQRVHRDQGRHKYAASARFSAIDGEWHNMAKETPGKQSQGGLRTTRWNKEIGYYADDERNPNYDEEVLQPVFEDGVVLRNQTFDNVRSNARLGVKVIKEITEMPAALAAAK